MPFKSQLHVDKLLSNMSIKYRNVNFIAMDVFPEIPVKKDTDLYRIYDRDFRIPDTRRANKGISNTHFWEVSSASYVLERHALKDYVSNDDADNYDMGDLRADTTEELTDVIMRRLELTVASLFTTTNWSLNVSLAAANQFSANTTVSDPIPVFDTGATEIVQNAGILPNYAIVRRETKVAIKNHTSVLERVKYTSAEVSNRILAGLMDVPMFFEPVTAYDTSPKGLGPSITSIWPDNAFLGYKPERPSIKRPSAGYIFRKSTPGVKRWFDDERDAEAIEVEMKFQARVVASLAGFLIRDTE